MDEAGSSVAPLILASRSPQRAAILEQLGIQFEQLPQDIEELERIPSTAKAAAGSAAGSIVLENARRKALAAQADGLVLAVDTEVLLGDELLGKARDQDEADAFLRRLSGRPHLVLSGLVLLDRDGERSGVERTDVTFRQLDERMRRWYLGTGEWRDRAGAYAIQGRGAALVQRIDGDFWNVVGLPVPLLLRLAPELVGT